jgi:hypothetical protein
MANPANVATTASPATRVVRARGIDAYPSWAPTGDRVAYFAVREGVPTVWVSPVDPTPPARARGATSSAAPDPVARPRPAAGRSLQRHGGTLWSPDAGTILIGELPEPEPTTTVPRAV